MLKAAYIEECTHIFCQISEAYYIPIRFQVVSTHVCITDNTLEIKKTQKATIMSGSKLSENGTTTQQVQLASKSSSRQIMVRFGSMNFKFCCV